MPANCYNLPDIAAHKYEADYMYRVYQIVSLCKGILNGYCITALGCSPTWLGKEVAGVALTGQLVAAVVSVYSVVVKST